MLKNAAVQYRTWAMPESSPAPIPRWRIDCRHCLESFTHSYVGRPRKLEDYLHPTEPDFPAGGVELECPGCKTKAVYQATEVRYQFK
jgi:hypothetical protein